MGLGVHFPTTPPPSNLSSAPRSEDRHSVDTPPSIGICQFTVCRRWPSRQPNPIRLDPRGSRNLLFLAPQLAFNWLFWSPRPTTHFLPNNLCPIPEYHEVRFQHPPHGSARSRFLPPPDPPAGPCLRDPGAGAAVTPEHRPVPRPPAPPHRRRHLHGVHPRCSEGGEFIGGGGGSMGDS